MTAAVSFRRTFCDGTTMEHSIFTCVCLTQASEDIFFIRREYAYIMCICGKRVHLKLAPSAPSLQIFFFTIEQWNMTLNIL